MESFDIKQFVQKFIEEAHGLLNELESNLLELEKNTANQELIESIFRAMHTIKGISGMYGYDAMGHFTHNLENVYDAIRNKSIAFSTEIFDLTFRSADHLRKLLDDKDLSNKENNLQHLELTNELNQLTQKLGIAKEQKANAGGGEIFIENYRQMATWQIIFRVSDELLRRGINILYLFQDLAKLGTFYIEKAEMDPTGTGLKKAEYWDILLLAECKKQDIEEIFVFVLDDCKIVRLVPEDIFEYIMVSQQLKEIPDDENMSIVEYVLGTNTTDQAIAPVESSPQTKNVTKNHPQSNTDNKKASISVSAEKLDKLMYIVSEMVTLKSEMQNAGDKKDLELLMEKVYKFDKLTKVLRNITLSARLVPISELTLKFKRLIRDLSQSLNKNVEMELEGGEVELDTNLIAQLADPLLHIIRNSLDHGIELPEVRKAAGKPEKGTIRISVNQSGNYIFITIHDDGSGIDKEKIRQKAIDKGLVQPQAVLTDKEIFDFIFLPGFSTATAITEVSGRGVGMDVVKRKITELRGEIQIDTVVGKGTSFTIKLKQTISITDTLLFKVENSFFAVPIEEVEACYQEKHAVLADLQNDQLKIHNQLVPIVYLRKIFKLGKSNAPEKEKLIVIKKQQQNIALVADSIIGQYQAVIKPINEDYIQKDYIIGASIMGDGCLAIILDTNKLIQKIN
jgi:two-component system, chemotaxis family, sensor kinase CheA